MCCDSEEMVLNAVGSAKELLQDVIPKNFKERVDTV